MKSNNIFRGIFGIKSKKDKALEKYKSEIKNRDATISNLKKEVTACYVTIKVLEEKLSNKEGLINVANFCIEERVAEIESLKSEVRKLNAAKGGYTSKINSLNKELEITKRKLKESMTDKYLIKKIPSGKVPKGQAIRSKARPISNQERKRLDELGGLRESNDE